MHSVLTLFTTGGQVAPGVTVTNHAVAQECLTDGVAGGDSYRCFTGRVSPGGPSFVFDPCFAAPGPGSPRVLLCPTNPVRDTAIELEASTLPPPTAEPARVWAMELADQQACVFVNAAWGGLGPFSCSPPPSAASGGSGTTVADCHPPEGGIPWWQADCQAQEQEGSPFSAVRVLSVWG
ncbi:hypothetical protein [Aciditerrimonas ferrireducens]|uniref:hypothetical protein n=1 Tax=Aciditerrimonas ferrireducens TaxID=667306 RepID=UPI0020069190|nr:hypothetical protein [Aciditerrimonas ferrireducens]MCK4175923.1 hypothetical protein [Aciditerrimonas ferrireducens]